MRSVGARNTTAYFLVGEFCYKRVRLYHAMLHFKTHLLLALKVPRSLSRDLVATSFVQFKVDELQQQVGSWCCLGAPMIDLAHWCQGKSSSEVVDVIMKDQPWIE